MSICIAGIRWLLPQILLAQLSFSWAVSETISVSLVDVCFNALITKMKNTSFYKTPNSTTLKASPQAIPAACKMAFLRHEMLLQASTNALHVLSSWELHWSVPWHRTPRLSGCVKLHFLYLTRKQLKLWIFMVAFHMSWQWVSSSLPRSAMQPEPSVLFSDSFLPCI